MRDDEKEELKEGISNHSSQTMLLSTQIAPIIDRIGRLLVDVSPHFASIANPTYYVDQSSEIGEGMHNPLQIPIMPNNSDVSQVCNIINRYIFGENPNVEIHMHPRDLPAQIPNQIPAVLTNISEIPINVSEGTTTENPELTIQVLPTFSYKPISSPLMKKPMVYNRKPVKENSANAFSIKKAASPKLLKSKAPVCHKIIRGNSIEEEKAIIIKKCA